MREDGCGLAPALSEKVMIPNRERGERASRAASKALLTNSKNSSPAEFGGGSEGQRENMGRGKGGIPSCRNGEGRERC